MLAHMALTIAHIPTSLQNSEKHVLDGGLGNDPTTEFVLGTRAYSAHICLHVNATASHAIAPSYASLIKTFD